MQAVLGTNHSPCYRRNPLKPGKACGSFRLYRVQQPLVVEHMRSRNSRVFLKRLFHEPLVRAFNILAVTGTIPEAETNPELPTSMHQTVTHFEIETNPTVPYPKFPHGHAHRSKPRYVLNQPASLVAPESGFATACPPARIPPASSTV